MAKCIHCGRWAGFFNKEHDECAVAAGKVEETTKRLTLTLPPVDPDADPFLLRPAPPDESNVKVTELRPSRLGSRMMTPTKVPLSDAVDKTDYVALVKSFMVKYPPGSEMTITKGKTFRKISIPGLNAIVMAILDRAKVVDDGHWLAGQVTAWCFQDGHLDGGFDSFRKWMGSNDSPNELRFMAREWHELIYWAAFSLAVSERRHDELFDPIISEAFPYLQIWSDVCKLEEHSVFDQFAALSIDPIWQSIWPPNSWLCTCSVVPLSEFDLSSTDEAQTPGADRIEPKLVNSCLAWYQRSPRAALAMLRPAK